MYIEKPISQEWIEEMLENARWAPTHRRTEPWRFHVFRGEARHTLADAMASAYRTHTPVESFKEGKLQKIHSHVLRADTVIAIVMQRDLQERIPEWEEVASVAAAVQNMWLTAAAFGLGAYWSTPAFYPYLGQFLQLQEGQRCMGLFYLGHHEMLPMDGQRTPLAEKVVWYTDQDDRMSPDK